MKGIALAALVSAAFSVPAMAQAADPAQTDPAPAAEASPHTVTGNLGVFSSYRFRGIDQTFGKPALQGGVDYAHASGFYLGNWNSNVSSGAGFPSVPFPSGTAKASFSSTVSRPLREPWPPSSSQKKGSW